MLFDKRSMIKESFDNLPSGICFFDERNVLVMCNRQMHRIAYSLSGQDLQQLSELRQMMEAPLPAKDGDNFILEDGTIWHISENPVEDENGNRYIQFVASDVTDIRKKQESINESNEELSLLNERLKSLMEDVNKIVREEETLSIKMRIHDELGHNMLAARKLLFENASAKQIRENCGAWKKTIEYLNHINHMEEREMKSYNLYGYAVNIGVRLNIEGDFPKEQRLKSLFVNGIKECINNCVKHAKGKNVYVNMEDNTLTVTNDGEPPKERITEAGGLLSLRLKAEEAGCDMLVESRPAFKLVLMPKNK